MSMLKLPPTRLGRFADSVGFHLRRSHEAAQQHVAASLADTGLMPIHAEVLAMIGDNPGTIPSVVAEALGRDRSSVTGILRTLLDRGLIERARTTRDRRAALLQLSANGEAMLQRVQERVAACDATLDGILGEGKPALLDQLRRITAALAEGDRNGDPGHDDV
jgi:MarR family transcriptional regulator, temperature-dependent positive regulator of motility